MTDKIIKMHKFSIRSLSTQTVTLYPDRAQVVRQIRDIPLEVHFPSRVSSVRTLNESYNETYHSIDTSSSEII